LFALFIFLLDQKIKHGPDDPEQFDDMYARSAQLFEK
jgi:hypothetical protein